MKENRLLFTNALIVLPTETINGSLAVEDGKITGIFESGTELPGFTEVDVHGKALMPGAIDTHVHMWDPSPLNYREDWACGSQCAASGGITTIIDMPLSVPPVVDKAMMMAVNVLQGGEASDIVIPAVWFDASNMDDPEISRILYD